MTERVCEALRAECAVRRQILSPGAAAAKRVQWTKQRATAGAALRFSQAFTRRENRLSARGLGGRNFCRAAVRRNGFPLKRGAFATRCKRKAFWLLYLSLNKAHRNGAAAFLLQGLEGPHDQESFSRFFSLHAGCVHCFSSRDAGWSRLTRYRKMIVDVEQTFLRYMRKGGRL